MHIRDVCKRRGITMADLASEIGVEPLTVYRWQNGTRSPHIQMLKKIADVLGVTTDELLADKSDCD